jgi:hypothetical protein
MLLDFSVATTNTLKGTLNSVSSGDEEQSVNIVLTEKTIKEMLFQFVGNRLTDTNLMQ